MSTGSDRSSLFLTENPDSRQIDTGFVGNDFVSMSAGEDGLVSTTASTNAANLYAVYAGHPSLFTSQLIQGINSYQGSSAAMMAGHVNGGLTGLSCSGVDLNGLNAGLFGQYSALTNGRIGLGHAMMSINDIHGQQNSSLLAHQVWPSVAMGYGLTGRVPVHEGEFCAEKGVIGPWRQNSAGVLGKIAASSAQSEGKGAKSKRSKEGKPKRPLSAYNLFFRAERARILAKIPKINNKDEEGDELCQQIDIKDTASTGKQKKRPHGKIGFESLAKIIGQRWRELDKDQVKIYKKDAEVDMTRYKSEMEAFSARKYVPLYDEDILGVEPSSKKIKANGNGGC